MNKKVIGVIAVILIVAIAVGAYFSHTPDDDLVKIGYMAADYDAALIVANATGMYQTQGVNVNISSYNDDLEIITAMANGEVDVAYMDINHVLKYIEKGVSVKIISASQNGGSGIIVSNQSNVSSIHDLEGKRITIPSEDSMQYILFSHYLKQNGMSVDDLNISSYSCSEVNKSIKKGKIDVAVLYEPYVGMNQIYGSKLLTNSDTLLPNHPNCVMIATDDFISKHPDETKKVVQVHENATRYINNNTDAVIRMVPLDDILNPVFKKCYYDNASFVYGLDDDFKQNIDNFMNIEVDLGFLKQPISHDKLFWDGS